jgi:hypothetical protein
MKTLIVILGLFSLCSCGVKGNPQPPLQSPVLGRGEPNFSKATESVRVKKLKNKFNNSSDPEWDEAADFPEANEEK